MTDELYADVVSSAVWHPAGAVLSTCSGQRHFLPEVQNVEASDSEDDSEISFRSSLSAGSSSSEKSASHPKLNQCFDNSLAIWAI